MISGICSSFSVVICRDIGHYQVTQTAAHELAHKYIINFTCQHKHKTDCNTTEYKVVKYVEQDKEAQKCSFLGPKQNRN